MKTKTLSILVLVGLAGFFGWGYLSEKTASTASVQGISGKVEKTALTTEQTFYDFGMISMKNGLVQKEFTVTNLGNEDILLSKVVTSCMCTNAFVVNQNGLTKGPFGMVGHGGAVPPANDLIKSGESRIIRVVFDPNAHGPAGIGKINRFITLTDSEGSSIQFEIKATVTP